MAQYVVTTYEVDVVGRLWMGGIGSTTYKMPMDTALQVLALDSDGLRRSAVKDWLDTHSGDFQAVDDFRASLAAWDSPFETEEGEIAYYDTLNPPEEDWP